LRLFGSEPAQGLDLTLMLRLQGGKNSQMVKHLRGRDHLIHVSPAILPFGLAVGLERIKFRPVQSEVTNPRQSKARLHERVAAAPDDFLTGGQVGLLDVGEDIECPQKPDSWPGPLASGVLSPRRFLAFVLPELVNFVPSEWARPGFGWDWFRVVLSLLGVLRFGV
jgi:hypothetical protein